LNWLWLPSLLLLRWNHQRLAWLQQFFSGKMGKGKGKWKQEQQQLAGKRSEAS